MRLAARLAAAPSSVRPPQALILTTGRRGVASGLRHAFGAQGIPSLAVDLMLLWRQRGIGNSLQREFSAVRYVLVDAAGGGVQELCRHAGLLEQMHLVNGHFTVVMLGDDPTSVSAAKLCGLNHLYLVSDLPQLMAAAGIPAESPLTARERSVLEHISTGATNQQAASALGISVATVKTYLERAQGKLKSYDRASTVATALRRGWL